MDLDKIESGEATTVDENHSIPIPPQSEGRAKKNTARRITYSIGLLFLIIGALIGLLVDVTQNDRSPPFDEVANTGNSNSNDIEDSASAEGTNVPENSENVPEITLPEDEEATSPELESEGGSVDEGGMEQVVAVGQTTVDDTLSPVSDGNRNDTRLESIIRYLVKNNVSKREELEIDGTYANQAVKWIANEDPLMLPIPDTRNTNSSLTEDDSLTDRYIMTLMYFATGGPKWVDSFNFLTEHGVCAWMKVIDSVPVGVGCDSDGRIVALSLNKNGLQNSLPAEVGLLTNLIVLELEVNFMVGSIPDSYQALTALEKLHIGSNGFTGTLPFWMGELDRLLTLQVGYNSLEGEVPSEITTLPALRVLSLGHNNFEGELNSLFSSRRMTGLQFLEGIFLDDNKFHGTLSSEFLASTLTLRQLDISDNSLAGSIPDHLFRYTNLEVLDIHDNQFSSLPQTFDANSALSFFAAQKNELSGPIPETIVNLSQLKHLDLSQNLLTGKIPESFGENLVSLSYLFLAENDFEAGPIPLTISNMASLKELSLKNTSRTGVIPYTLGLLTELVFLDLDNNSLRGEIPPSLGGTLTNLQVLLLNRNNLSGEIPSSFGELSSIELLFLEGNNFTGGLEHFCSNQDKVSTLVAQCSLCDAVPDCCTKCCGEGEHCNNEYSHVADLDPLWHMDYERIEYTLDKEDWFVQ